LIVFFIYYSISQLSKQNCPKLNAHLNIQILILNYGKKKKTLKAVNTTAQLHIYIYLFIYF